jgi:hypothetical protein
MAKFQAPQRSQWPHTRAGSPLNRLYAPLVRYQRGRGEATMKRITFKWTRGNRVVEYDLVVTKTERWKRMPEAKDPAWSVIIDGDRTWAMRPVDDGTVPPIEELLDLRPAPAPAAIAACNGKTKTARTRKTKTTLTKTKPGPTEEPLTVEDRTDLDIQAAYNCVVRDRVFAALEALEAIPDMKDLDLRIERSGKARAEVAFKAPEKFRHPEVMVAITIGDGKY